MGLFKKIFSKITGKKNSDIKAEVTNTLNFSYDNIAYTEDYKSIVLDEEPNVVKAIFLTNYNNKGLRDDYPGYYKYQYNIESTIDLHKEFINQGFLTELKFKDDAKIILNTLTNPELKQILKNNRLKLGGKKSELIDRILESNLSENEVNLKDKLYTLSDKSKSYLSKYDYLYKLHTSTLGIELEEYIHNKNELEKAWETNKVKFNDVCWAILNKRTLKYSFNKDYGLLRNNFYDMYVITKSEGKANLELLCNVLYIDLSGMENNNSVEDLEIMFYKNSPIAPALSDEIKKYKLSDIIDALKNVRLNLPFSYFNLNQMIDIITDEYNDLIYDVEKLKNTANLPNEESEYYNYTDFSKYRF